MFGHLDINRCDTKGAFNVFACLGVLCYSPITFRKVVTQQTCPSTLALGGIQEEHFEAETPKLNYKAMRKTNIYCQKVEEFIFLLIFTYAIKTDRKIDNRIRGTKYM